jgi:hypothetical protein
MMRICMQLRTTTVQSSIHLRGCQVSVLVIDLWAPQCECTLCGVVTSDKYGIAIWEDTIVPDDYEGEWGGSPVCKRCYDAAAQVQARRPGEIITFSDVTYTGGKHV